MIFLGLSIWLESKKKLNEKNSITIKDNLPLSEEFVKNLEPFSQENIKDNLLISKELQAKNLNQQSQINIDFLK